MINADSFLSERLSCICKLALRGELLIDIGCDHSYVPIFLIQNGLYNRAVACDINSNALNIAKNNISINNLDEKISCVLSDGLKNIDKNADCVVIAGMGAQLIAKILKSSEKKLNRFERFILQPQGKTDILRKALCELSLFIEDEMIVFEKGHYYSIMRVTGNKKKYDEMLSLYGFDTYIQFGILPIKKDLRDIFSEYVRFKKTGYNLILKAFNNSNFSDIEKEADIRAKLSICDSLHL